MSYHDQIRTYEAIYLSSDESTTYCDRCGEEGASIPAGTYPLGMPPALCPECEEATSDD